MTEAKPPRIPPWVVFIALVIFFPLTFFLCGSAGFFVPFAP